MNAPRRRLSLVKGPLAVAVALEQQAARLRAVASAWADGIAPEVVLHGHPYSTFVLSYMDLIDDAEALEADATKLRTLFA